MSRDRRDCPAHGKRRRRSGSVVIFSLTVLTPVLVMSSALLMHSVEIPAASARRAIRPTV